MADLDQSEKSPLVLSSPRLSNDIQSNDIQVSLKDPSILTSFQSRKSPSPSSQEVERNKWEGLTWTLLLSVMAGVVGSSTQFGFNTGVINNPKDVIRESIDGFSKTEMNVAVAIFAIGGMVGALPTGFVADSIGRKYTMLLNNVVVFVAVGLQSFAVHPFMFILGRFIVGINAGVSTVVVPLYISEISTVDLRGSMGVCHQMAIVTSIFLSQIFGLSFIFGRPDSEFYGWRILFALSLLFSIFQLTLLPWLPESPKYLFLKRRNREASIRALKRLRGKADIHDELQLMQAELEELERPREKIKLGQFFKVPYLRYALITSVVLHLAQQFSGITGIFYYSNDLFETAGVENGDIATVFTVGLVLVLVTIVTVFLIEVLGRRTLMLYGLAGMAIFFTFLTSMFCFQDGYYGKFEDGPSKTTVPGVLLIISSLGITALFALGPGSIPWLMVAELFKQDARPTAVTVATIVNWLANFTIGLLFPYILDNLFPYGTFIFTVTCTLSWTYLYLFLPETKGRNVEDITSQFKAKTERDGSLKQGKPTAPHIYE